MVYRPPKKSSAGPRFPGPQTSSDPLAGPLSRAPDGEEILRGDDRNFVKVDESYAGGDWEDRLWLFWNRQKYNILILACLICAGVIGWQGWKLYQQHLVEVVQTEYQKAADGPGLLAFAQAHPGTTLGKLAQLQAADAFYKDGKFADAAKAYADAIPLWGAETYGQRARVGQAMSLLQNNDATGARQQLEALANDTQAVAYYRSEAAFDLAVMDTQAGNQKDALQWLDKIQSLKDQNWMNEANMFVSTLSTLPGSKTQAATSTPAMPITLTNGTTAPAAPIPAAPAVSATKVSSAPTQAAAPAKSSPSPAAPSVAPTSAPPANTSGGFDLTPLLKASGGTTSN